MFALTLIAAGGLVFAFEHATVAGKMVLLLLAVGSVFSWSIMITKLRVIQFARKQNARFLAAPQASLSPRIEDFTRYTVHFSAPGGDALHPKCLPSRTR